MMLDGRQLQAPLRTSLGHSLDSGCYRTPRVAVDPHTAAISLCLRRPTSEKHVQWGPDTTIETRVVLVVDGVEYAATGRATGGIRFLPDGTEAEHYRLVYHPPVVRRGSRILRISEVDHRSLWQRLTFRPRRVEAFAEVRVIRGQLDLEVVLAESTTAPTPWYPIHNSVAFDAAASALETGGDGVMSLTHTSTGSNRAVFAGVAWANALAGTGSTSMTYAGAGMTEMWDLLHSTATGQQNAGYRLAGQTTGAQTVTSTVVSTEPTRQFLGVISMTGVDQTTPVGTPATAEGVDGPATVTVGSVGAEDMVVDNLGVVQAGSAPTVGANQISQWDEEHVGHGHFCAGSTQVGSAGGVMSWTTTSDFWLIGAVAFKAAASGPTIPELAAARAYGQMPTILPPSMRASGMRMGGPKTERIR